MQNTLLCRSILANRHVIVSGQCPICLCGAEDVKHLLFLCHRAKQVWKNLGLDRIISQACEIDRAGQAILESIICDGVPGSPVLGQSALAETFAITCWYLWWERRQAVNGEKV